MPDVRFLSDDVTKPTTRHIKKHIVKNRRHDDQGAVDEEESEEDEKPASSTITIVTKNKNPPNPADVVLASGERITIHIPKTPFEKPKYELNVAYVKSIVREIIGKPCLDFVMTCTLIPWLQRRAAYKGLLGTSTHGAGCQDFWLRLVGAW
jgi:hypothetical protein